MYDFFSSTWVFILIAILGTLAITLRKKGSFFYWAARITAILDILYLSWESLETGGYSPSHFFSLNKGKSIPLLLLLIISWNDDLFGALSFAGIGIFFLSYYAWGDFPIGIVPLLIAFFFAMHRFQSKKKTNHPI